MQLRQYFNINFNILASEGRLGMKQRQEEGRTERTAGRYLQRCCSVCCSSQQLSIGVYPYLYTSSLDFSSFYVFHFLCVLVSVYRG